MGYSYLSHWVIGKIKMCICCCSVAKSYLSTCDPMDCSVAGFPVLHHLPECAQTHVHWVIQSSHPLSPPSLPALNLSQHQNFSHELALCICNIQHLYATFFKVIFSRWVTVFKNSWNGFVNTLCNFDLLGNLWVSFQFFWPLWFQYIHQNSQLWADGPFILNYFWLLRILAKQKLQINCLDFVIVGWTFGIEQQ